MPVFKDLYARVASGEETHRVITSCGKKNYKDQLGKELAKMGNSEMWEAGKTTRSLRPAKKEAIAKNSKATGTGGRQSN
jgi:ketol-acid reductoisomerase